MRVIELAGARRSEAEPRLGAPIGRVSESTGLSPRAIRYYEARGLIATRRDPQNARRYDAAARADLRLIASLRAAGLGLEAVAQVLRERLSSSPDAARRRLAQALEDRRAMLRDQIDVISALIENLRETGSSAPSKAVDKDIDDAERGRLPISRAVGVEDPHDRA